MDDLINRQAAIDAIFSEPLYESGMKKRDADAVVPAIYEKIKLLPSAQPEQKKGKWIDAIDTSGGDYYRCSECGTYIEKMYFANDYTVNFCPNCGVEMERE